jgi:hypothetical protein
MKLAEHVSRFKTTLNRHKGIYDMLGHRFSVNPQVFLWRNRFHFIKSFAHAGIMMTRGRASENNIAPTLREWRRSNAFTLISRYIVASICSDLTPVTPAEINFHVEGQTSPSMVTKCLRLGVELGLLYKQDNEYHATPLLYDECLDLVVAKVMDDRLVAFCRLVVMFADMRAAAKQAGEMPIETLPDNINYKSLAELLFLGVYDDEIFDDNDDDDKEDPSPVRLVS